MMMMMMIMNAKKILRHSCVHDAIDSGIQRTTHLLIGRHS